MLAEHNILPEYTCSLSERDKQDLRHVMLMGRVAWNTRTKQPMMVPETNVSVYRMYTSEGPSNIGPLVHDFPYFLVQPSIIRACAATGNRHIRSVVETLVDRSIKHYNAPWSTVSCVLSEWSVERHRHFVDPEKKVTTTTFYWTLGDSSEPIDTDFFIEEEKYNLSRQGSLTFDPYLWHGTNNRDKHFRLYVLIDNA